MTITKHDPTVLLAKAIVWVAGKAIQTVPVVGPIFMVVEVLNDVAEIRKAWSKEEKT